MRAIDDGIVREYRRASRNDGTVPALRAFFNDAMRPDAGRLVTRNPFAGLRLKQSRGRRDIQPPAQKDAARLIALADELTPPSFAAYLHTDVYEGVRPGELDALRWDDLDFTHAGRTQALETARPLDPWHSTVVAAGKPVRVGRGECPTRRDVVCVRRYGLSFSVRTCVCGEWRRDCQRSRSSFYAGVRIAADRHKDPLGWRARGVDEECQAASALLCHDRAEERVVRTVSVVLHGAWRRGAIFQP